MNRHAQTVLRHLALSVLKVPAQREDATPRGDETAHHYRGVAPKKRLRLDGLRANALMASIASAIFGFANAYAAAALSAFRKPIRNCK